MNRYEQITSANIEELARILVRISESEGEYNCCRYLPECMAMADSDEEISQEKCVGCMMRWLEEEATSERMKEGKIKMQSENIIKALRSTPSRSKRALLDEAANRIEDLEADLKAALYDLKSCETCYTCKHKKTKDLCNCCWHANKWEWQGREK